MVDYTHLWLPVHTCLQQGWPCTCLTRAIYIFEALIQAQQWSHDILNHLYNVQHLVRSGRGSWLWLFKCSDNRVFHIRSRVVYVGRNYTFWPQRSLSGTKLFCVTKTTDISSEDNTYSLSIRMAWRRYYNSDKGMVHTINEWSTAYKTHKG